MIRRTSNYNFYLHYIKPLFDFIVALILFAIASPLFILIIIFLALANRGKIFFHQRRPGKNERVFKLLKFKTMNDFKDAAGKLLPDEARITAIGKFIRKTSLDEIPQLINVIKGDMSLVGPRPLLIEYLPRYTNDQKRRHEVLPGITGWAQVNGRNAISWTKKFEYDLWYVDNVSFKVDIKILWLTIKKVFKSEGINQKGHVTMPFFEGTDQK